MRGQVATLSFPYADLLPPTPVLQMYCYQWPAVEHFSFPKETDMHRSITSHGAAALSACLHLHTCYCCALTITKAHFANTSLSFAVSIGNKEDKEADPTVVAVAAGTNDYKSGSVVSTETMCVTTTTTTTTITTNTARLVCLWRTVFIDLCTIISFLEPPRHTNPNPNKTKQQVPLRVGH